MSTPADLNELMNQFRLASRELFNHFFRVPDPYANGQHAWLMEERFRDVQAVLFQQLVAEQMSLSLAEYGNPQPNVLVEPRHGGAVPIMLNRDIDSGYWDHPVKEVGTDAHLLFVSFFDWDQLDYRDNRYVRVQVVRWSTNPDVGGKHGLIESHYVRFAKG